MRSHWSQTLHDCENVLSQHNESNRTDKIPPETLNCINKFDEVFLTSMSDDLHTPVVLAALSEPLKTANDLLHTRKVFSIFDSNVPQLYLYIEYTNPLLLL